MGHRAGTSNGFRLSRVVQVPVLMFFPQTERRCDDLAWERERVVTRPLKWVQLPWFGSPHHEANGNSVFQMCF